MSVDTSGAVQIDPRFLPEQNDLANWDMKPAQIIQLPSPDLRLLIVGNTSQAIPSRKESFYRVFDQSLISTGTSIRISGEADEEINIGRVFGNANQWVIGYSRENSGGDLQAEILLTDSGGTPASGYPKALGANLLTADGVGIRNNEIFVAGLNQNNNLYLAKTGMSGGGSPTVVDLGFSVLLRDMSILSQPDRFLLAGQRAGKAFFLTFNTSLSTTVNSMDFGNSNINIFNAAIQSTDCGFAACGISVNAQTLFFVKTDEAGQVP